MAEDIIICRCEEVSKEEIINAYRSGAETVDAIKRKTRAGMGLCQGLTCRRMVTQIFAEEKGQSVADQIPARFRTPVRPVKMGLLCK